MTLRVPKSVRYYSDDMPEGFDDFYTGMFIEDVANGLMPIGGEGRAGKFSVRVVPPDDRLEEMLIAGLTMHGRQESLASALCEFFRLTANEVCARDRAAYEIVYDETDDGTATGFAFVHINAKRLRVRRRYIRQELPEDYALRRGYPGYVDIDRSEVLLFHAPSDLGVTIRRTRESMSRVKDEGFASLTLEAQHHGLPYDFAAHQSALNLALADVLKATGWTARGLFDDRVMSYYLVYMRLIFEKFKLRLREAFLQQLNDAISEVGKFVHSSSKIELSGLPTLEEIDVALAELRDGKKPFTIIMEPFLRY
jgi:hypothetical protein